jgi:hypothetical protein
VGRAVQIASILLVIAAVVCVLVTPDLTDDVDGVFHDYHADLLVLFCAFQVGLLITTTANLFPLEFLPFHHALDLIVITCVRLC